MKLEKKAFSLIWLIYHLAIIVIFSFVIAGGGKGKTLIQNLSSRIDADLFNMLPKSVTSRALTAADDRLTEKTAQNLFILVSNKDFLTAKAAAAEVYDALKDSDRFKSITLYSQELDTKSLLDFVRTHKESLLPARTIREIENGTGEDYAFGAVDKIFSSFNIVPLDIDNDPFCLTQDCVESMLEVLQSSSPSVTEKDGVMAVHDDKKDLWYVMIRAIASPAGAALASPKNAVAKIYEVTMPREVNGTRFVFSGTMFHSYASSTNATKEIAIISFISLLIVAVILLFVFRSVRPILFSLMSIGVSCLMAFCATIAAFGKMHILTLVFGTSLIGSCIDYSLHYFIAWKGNKKCATGDEIRAHLLKGLTLSLLSTVLCYFVLLFAPFSLLRQMSVFSMAGIISTYLTAICVYPLIRLPKKRRIKLLKKIKIPKYNKKIVGRVVIGSMFAISIALLIINRKHVIVQNNVKTLYKIEGRELSDEVEAGSLLKYNPTGWFIISGDDKESALENEERVTALLEELNKDEEKAGFIAVTKFVPSIAQQRRSRAAAEKLLSMMEDQYLTIGYSAEDAARLTQEHRAFFSNLNKKESKDAGAMDFVTLDNIPESLRQALDSMCLGEIDKKYWTVVLPARVTDNKAYKKIADDVPGVYFINKITSMNEDLDALSKIIIILFGVVYLLLFGVLKIFYTLKQTCKIISVPLLIILFIFAGFAVTKTSVEFFSITGMILVFGLGLDYVIYMIENEKRIAIRNSEIATTIDTDETQALQLEPFAILLSFLTTAISFGALSLSAFIPVHNIGMSIFIGLVVSFVATHFYTRLDAQ